MRTPYKSPFAGLVGKDNRPLPAAVPAAPPAAAEQFETHPANSTAMAQAILAAAEKARAGGTAQPKPTGVAAQILAAGRQRRAEEN